MEAKQFLNQIRDLYKEIEKKKEKIAALEDKLTSISGGFKVGEVVTGSKDGKSHEKMIIKKLELEDALREDFKRLLILQKSMMKVIDKLNNAEERDILILRYISGKPWKSIARYTKINLRRCYRIHNQALINIEVILDEN